MFEEIEELEDKGMWTPALELIKSQHELNPSKQTAIRLLFVCWYVLIEWGYLKLYADEYDNFDINLKKVTEFLFCNYEDDVEVNFYLGYMISMSAWDFSDNVAEWEKKADELLAYAVEKETNNPIYQMIYFANTDFGSEEYKYWCEQAKPLVQKLYSGKGEFNLYFRQVLSR